MDLPSSIKRCSIRLRKVFEGREEEKKEEEEENDRDLLWNLEDGLKLQKKSVPVTSKVVTELVITHKSWCNELLTYSALHGFGGLDLFEFPALCSLTVSLGALGASVVSARNSGAPNPCLPKVSTLTLIIDQASDALFCKGLEALSMAVFPSLTTLSVEFGANRLSLGSREKRVMCRMVNHYVAANGHMDFDEVADFLNHFKVDSIFIAGLFDMKSGAVALNCYTQIVNHPHKSPFRRNLRPYVSTRPCLSAF